MDRMKTNWTVLARIPDMDTFGKGTRTEEEGGTSSSTLGGRILNRSLSFNLLAGLALFLIAASVFPFFSGRNEAGSDSASAVDPLSQWQTGASAAPDEARVARAPAPRPMTLVSATPEQASAPEIIPLEGEEKNEPSPTVDTPRMSSWPNPAQSSAPRDAGPETPRVGVNRPMAVRPTEYQADARSGKTPQGPGVGPRENTNTNDKPAARNRYDSTRPSVY